MRTYRIPMIRFFLVIALMATLVAVSSRMKADTGACSGQSITLPFTDVPSSNIFFCAIAGAYFVGLTNGTSATTYSPSDPVTREQMAAFITRTLDHSLKRGSRRAALDQFWTTQGATNLGLTTVGSMPNLVKSDGTDVWVVNSGSATISRVRASDGRLLETWTGANNAYGVLCAMGKVFVTQDAIPGGIYEIDPTQPAGAVTTAVTGMGGAPQGIAFDGKRIWTANADSVSIVYLNPPGSSTVATGFNTLFGLVYDGANIWVADFGDNKIKKLDGNGNIIQSVAVGDSPLFPAFDGTNIWVPNANASTVTVVRASTGTVLATLSGNGLNGPVQAAFDGERILVTNFADSVSLWKASDLTPLGNFSTGENTFPNGVCSDGLNFWITLQGTNKLARF